MKSLFAKFWALTPWIKWLIAGVLAVLLVLLFVWGKDGLSNWNEKRKEANFDKSMARKDTEIAKLKQANEQLTGEIKQEIAKGQLKDQESEMLKAELAKYGKAAQDAVKKQTEAMQNYEEDKALINLNLSDFERCTDLCRERADIGFPCPRDHCAKFAGR